MCVLDMTEFSDHCPVTFSLQYNIDSSMNNKCPHYYDKIIWDSGECDSFLNTLENNRYLFDDVTGKLTSGEHDVNACIDSFSNTIYDLSFNSFGKHFFPNKRNKVKKSPWFDSNCKKAKADFLKAKRLFNSNKIDVNKLNFLLCRSNFAKIKRHARLVYYSKEKSKLNTMSKYSPRKFWKYINKFKQKSSISNNGITMDDFVRHFTNISNTPHNSNFDMNDYNFDNQDLSSIPLLDDPFTISEVRKTLSRLKRNKSCDLNNNVADFFIDANEFISPYLCTIFNVIYDSGIYPEAWSKGAIVPILKKGDIHNPSNYRGITLINI